ncbi:hypothetical protein FBY14_109146 [Azospirillum brasilense]|nr:hypothetical protein FBY14_109146 [Azospirillum brasilense]
MPCRYAPKLGMVIARRNHWIHCKSSALYRNQRLCDSIVYDKRNMGITVLTVSGDQKMAR